MRYSQRSKSKRLAFPKSARPPCLRRLRKLEARDLIRRVPGLSNGGYGWSLTSKQATDLGFVGISKHESRYSIEHDVRLSELRLTLEKAGIRIQWVAEHVVRYRAWEARTARGTVAENIPDGIMTVEIGDQIRAVSMELELSAKNTERYRKIFRAYQYKRHFWGLWYIVGHERIALKIKKIWRKVSSDQKEPRLLWSLYSDVCHNPVEATLHYEGNAFPLRKIFQIKSPAHSPAHPVSKPD